MALLGTVNLSADSDTSSALAAVLVPSLAVSSILLEELKPPPLSRAVSPGRRG